MNINSQNYEEYFVRYLDGELTPDEMSEVNLFLQQFPELRQELEAFKAAILTVDESAAFTGKENLKKGITAGNYDEYFIRKIEGDLTSAEEREVNEFLQFHPQYRRHLAAYELTRLKPDQSVVYENKRSLKKRVPGRIIPLTVRYVAVLAAAAAILLIVLMKGITWNQSGSLTADQIQEQNDPGATTNEQAVIEEENNSSIAEEKSVPGDVSQPRKKAEPMKKQVQLADATVVREEDMARLDDRSVNHIFYQPKFRKAAYRNTGDAASSGGVASPKTSMGTATSLARTLGSEFLKLSGREDYLKESSAFDGQEDRRKMGPVALNIKTEKFDLYHKFFKKKVRSNSSPDKNT